MQTIFATERLTAQDLIFLREIPEDTEEAPWMVMNDRQFYGAAGLAWSLRTYARQQQKPWYVGGMLPLYYLPPGATRTKPVAPDVFVAFIPDHPRDSLDIAQEGMPPFVMEVVSPSSVQHDLTKKTRLYRLLGVEEYVIVRLDLATPRLEGYHRVDGVWTSWSVDDDGRLWSAQLELWILLRESDVQAQLRDGTLLLTPQQEAQARLEAEAARIQAEAARDQAEAGRDQAEARAEQLQAELERLRKLL